MRLSGIWTAWAQTSPAQKAMMPVPTRSAMLRSQKWNCRLIRECFLRSCFALPLRLIVAERGRSCHCCPQRLKGTKERAMTSAYLHLCKLSGQIFWEEASSSPNFPLWHGEACCGTATPPAAGTFDFRRGCFKQNSAESPLPPSEPVETVKPRPLRAFTSPGVLGVQDMFRRPGNLPNLPTGSGFSSGIHFQADLLGNRTATKQEGSLKEVAMAIRFASGAFGKSLQQGCFGGFGWQ